MNLHTFLQANLVLIVGFVLALLLMGKLMNEHSHTGSALAWLLGIVFVPWLTIPVYLIFSGRKFRRLAMRKEALHLSLKDLPPPAATEDPVANALLGMTGAPPACGGNRVETLACGIETYKLLLKSIDEAKESINICVFILARDEVAQTLVEHLTAKAKQGVKVRLLVDAIGSLFNTGGFLDPLREAGGEVGVFMPVFPTRRRWSANLRNHRKIYIFDEKLAIVGGKNIGKDYIGPEVDPCRWIDFSIRVEGPTVFALMQIFAADWEFATHHPAHTVIKHRKAEEISAVGDITVQTFTSGPDTPENPLYDALLTAMVSARERIWIVTPYLVPDDTFLTTLCLMAKLNRKVNIVIPKKTDAPLADLARGYYLRKLHLAGVKIWLHQPVMVHSKIMIVDDEVGFTGSVNIDMRSLYLNYEIGAFVYDREITGQMAEVIEGLMAKSIPYTRRQARVRGVVQEMMENVSRLLSPLL